MSNQVPVTVLAGHSPRGGAIGLLAVPREIDAGDHFTRFFTLVDGEWGAGDLDYRAVSLLGHVDAASGDRAWWILGRNGEATRKSAAGTHRFQIPGAGLGVVDAHGYVDVIREIAGRLYVCGYGRQAYTFVDNAWTSIADDILTDTPAHGFRDIAGLRHDQVHAVGWQGEIWLHDGAGWHQDASPTTAHLHALACLDSGDMVACGHAGTVLRGRFNQWRRIPCDDTQTWWDVEVFNDSIYLAGNGHLARLEDDRIVPVDVRLGRAITTHQLHARDGVLWSFGEDDILMFDGTRCTEVIHPDNA